MNRLSLLQNKGIFDAQWKIRDPEWGVIIGGELIPPDTHSVPRNLGYQMFAQIVAHRPTVLDPKDKNVSWSAAIRSASNKVRHNKAEMKKYEDWFRRIMFAEINTLLEDHGLVADTQEWLLKYPLQYRKKMQALLDSVELCIDGSIPHFRYKAFPKSELQFTTVDADLICDASNDVKERQIMGPEDLKKILANPFIYACEKLFEKLTGYCGATDWPGICKKMDEAEDRIPNILFQWKDFSGFDMTTTPFEPLLLEVADLIMSHPNAELRGHLNRETILAVLRDSLVLDVDIGQGAVNYKAHGRASGDGWTTCWNTLITASVLRYVLTEAGVPEEFQFVMGKGDDSVIGFPEEYKQAVDAVTDRVFVKKQEFVEHGLGLICKFTREGHAEDVDFVSNYFFRNAQGKLRMTRIPARVVESICWTTAIPYNYSEQKRVQMAKELCYAKGSCLLAWSRGLPIWETLAKKMMQIGCHGTSSSYSEYADDGRVWGEYDDRDAYLAFLGNRYGMTQADVVSIERQINEISHIFEIKLIPELAVFFDDE